MSTTYGGRARIRVLAATTLLGAVGLSATSAAQEAEPTVCRRCTVGDAPDGLPGLLYTAVPRLHPALSASISGAGMYGVNVDPLGPGSMHHRIGGSLGAALHATPWLAFGVRVFGRVDSVSVMGQPDEDGMVGYPTLSVRASAEPSDGLAIGLDVQASVFGADAPSFDLGSTSVLLRALGAYRIRLGADANLHLALNAGYYIDNSRVAAPQTVTDPLQPGDQLSLGVSDVGAVVAGLGALYSTESIEVFGDLSGRIYVGGAQSVTGSSPIRLSAGARIWLMPEVFFLGLAADVRLTPQSAELVAPGRTNAPIEPAFQAFLQAGVRIGAETPPIVVEVQPEPEPEPEPEVTPPPPTSNTVRGRAVDADGTALANATVTLETAGGPMQTTTGPDGRWTVEGVPLGRVAYRIEAADHDTVTGELDVAAGEPLEASTAPLPRALPQGEIRGVIQGSNGRPVAAHIVIAPVGREVDADAEGSFAIEVPPGQYSVTISAPGHRPQTRQVTVEERGVLVLNAQLRSGH